jgi:hypothetical protein
MTVLNSMDEGGNNNDDEVIVETRKQSDKPAGGKTLSSQKIVGASKKIKKLK